MSETEMIRMIGTRIRRQRQAQHLSLRELADRAGLSNALLSKIENGKVASPISTYLKIVNALNIEFGSLVDVEPEQDLLHIPAKGGEGAETAAPGKHGYHFTPVASGWPNKNFDVFFLTYHPTDSESPRFSSDVDEFLFVTEGRIEFFHGEKRLLLEEGDSLIINANTPHGGKAFGGEKAEALLLSIRRSL